MLGTLLVLSLLVVIAPQVAGRRFKGGMHSMCLLRCFAGCRSCCMTSRSCWRTVTSGSPRLQPTCALSPCTDSVLIVMLSSVTQLAAVG